MLKVKSSTSTSIGIENRYNHLVFNFNGLFKKIIKNEATADPKYIPVHLAQTSKGKVPHSNDLSTS